MSNQSKPLGKTNAFNQPDEEANKDALITQATEALDSTVTALCWLSELFGAMLDQTDKPYRISKLSEIGRYIADDIANMGDLSHESIVNKLKGEKR